MFNQQSYNINEFHNFNIVSYTKEPFLQNFFEGSLHFLFSLHRCLFKTLVKHSYLYRQGVNAELLSKICRIPQPVEVGDECQFFIDGIDCIAYN